MLYQGRRYRPLESKDNDLAVGYDCVADELGSHTREGIEPLYRLDENRFQEVPM